MYGWIWRTLPGGLPGKLTGSLALLLAAVALLFIVVFPAVEASGTRVVFENAAHDFPQRVIYERDGDVLKARIEGDMGGQQQAMAWEYRKADLNARCPT